MAAFEVITEVFGFIFAKVEPLLALPVIVPLGFFKTDKSLLFYLFATLGWLWQVYVLLAWCILALMLTKTFSTQPTVEHHWMYYIMGFVGCLAPISFMLSFDGETDRTGEIRQFLTVTVTAAGFIGFAVIPSLMVPWHWFMQFVIR